MQLVLLCVFGWLLVPAAVQATLVTNGGFETSESVSPASPNSQPTTFGDWSGDIAGIVGAENGITPLEGVQMLHFITEEPTGQPLPDGVLSEMFQILNLSAFSGAISAGTASAQARAFFNRVAGNSETDIGFSIILLAYAGAPSSFPTQFGTSSHLARAGANLNTDGDVSTWESANVELLLPVNTDFLVVTIQAAENVFDDATDPAFDGHYADDVWATIVPEPSTAALLGAGLAGLAVARTGRARRRSDWSPVLR